MSDLSLSNTSASDDSLSSPSYSLGKRSILNGMDKRQKMKKDANDFVDYMTEYKLDPKYKTELCKSFTEQGFCAYGNKCRFAHGRNELFDKVINCKKYKQKECLSFFKNKFCGYGSRCHFRHEERKLSELDRSYYTNLLSMYPQSNEEEIFNMSEEQLMTLLNTNNMATKRLSVFRNKSSENQSSVTNHINTNKINYKYLQNMESYSQQPKFTINYSNLLPLF